MSTARQGIATSLLALTCALASCGPQDRTPGTPEATKTSTTSLPESSQELLSLLPADDAVPGWRAKGEPKLVGPGNLWELIDGAAEGYLTYGFQEAVSAHYSAGSRELIVDVYRMKDSLNAFGIYAQERNPAAQFVKEGVEGYVSGTTLNFWAGDYYVKITAFEEQTEIEHAIQMIAAAIGGKIGPTGSEPDEIAWFPKENRLPHSVTYLPRDVLGQSYFGSAFEARYRVGSAEYRLLVIDGENADAASQALATYRQFVSGQGKAPADLAMPGSDEGFAGEDSFYGQVLAARSGRYIVIALGVPSPAAGRAALGQLLSRLRRTTEVP